MPRLGFSEWLAYGCFAAGAIVLAIDQAIKLSRLQEMDWAKTITENNVWAFTPFAMLCISGAIIVFRAISSSYIHPTISAPTVGKIPDAIRLEVPNALDSLTNHELRLTAYNIAARVGWFADNYIRQGVEIADLKISIDEKTSRTAILDQAFNREFRSVYADDIITLQKGILSRRNNNKGSFLIDFPNGLLDWATVNRSRHHLISVSNRLP